MKRVLIVVGTRPNFIKVTQFKKLAKDYADLDIRIAHTGQHYDSNMAEIFFSQFELKPDYFLDITGGTPLHQMGEILQKLDNLISEVFYPDLIITPGDVNSTLAVAIVANKRNIELAHLESGLRSYDRDMPEEINRILTDEISQYYFVTEKSGLTHLEDEYKPGKAFLVGNTMIDTLVAFSDQIDQSSILNDLGVEDEYILMTIHRPSNVDSKKALLELWELINMITVKYTVLFPMHPRTINNIERFGLKDKFDQIKKLKKLPAVGYFEFQKLIKSAKLVLTDSGGIQEETTFCQVPCLTLRDNTERPITVDIGSNTLVPKDYNKIKKLIKKIESGTYKKGEIPPLWDGNATKRILDIINDL